MAETTSKDDRAILLGMKMLTLTQEEHGRMLEAIMSKLDLSEGHRQEQAEVIKEIRELCAALSGLVNQLQEESRALREQGRALREQGSSAALTSASLSRPPLDQRTGCDVKRRGPDAVASHSLNATSPSLNVTPPSFSSAGRSRTTAAEETGKKPAAEEDAKFGQVSFAPIVGLFCLYSRSLLPL